MPVRGRSWISYNFLAAIVIGIAWFAIQAIIVLQETDPTKLRVNRTPLGAAVIIVVEMILLALYLKAGELVGIVRTFAGIMGVVQLLQGVVVALIAHLTEGVPFPTASHYVIWYLAASNVLYALLGEGRSGGRQHTQERTS
jgi:hypothetical protein